MNDDTYATGYQLDAALELAKRSSERTVQDALRKLYFTVRMLHGAEMEQHARLRERTRSDA